ncbi:Bug family tripartite tricarboxylate transporter substrate binding protein [Pseudorhodoferax sp.]|uniref:Bug family tripartite tricarboxylate transporter substrate binding protein n=1 Tax=Pseudorhodoferax sp. TaxID=1993553 RepID=UPI002DD65878|nr:tripartite tricarboxylate transporter substrate binding protein [Pseudorhodoferax sp.]
MHQPNSVSPVRRRTLAALTALAASALLPAAAQAQDSNYPTRPIRVLVAFPAGGSADIVGRLVTQTMTQQTGWNFVIDNRPGAGGNLAFETAANAEADGYTLLFSTPGIVINPHLYRKVPYRWEAFAPVGLVGDAPLVLMANPKLPVKTIADLQALSRAKPGTLRFASSGNGSSSHLAMDVLRTMGDISYLHVPYRGGAAAMNDTMAGDLTDLTVQPIAESLPNIRAGRLHALGQTGEKRSPMAPDIPTIAEGGVKDYASTTWYVLLAPAKTPAPLIARLHGALDAALKNPELQDKLAKSGVQVLNAGPQQTADFMAQESRKWAKAIEASGTRID